MRQVDEKLTRNRPEDLVGFFGSGLIGFELIRVGLGFYHRGRNMARSGEIRPKSIQRRRDQAEIYSKPSRSCRNLAEFVKILPDLEGSGLDFVENGQKVVITRRKEKGFGLGRVSRVSKGKPTTNLRGVGLVSLEPVSNRRSCRIGWWRVGHRRVGRVERVTESVGHPK